MQTNRGTHGFSLTELMIVILIMGLLAAVSVPAMGRFLQSWKLNGEAQELATTVRLARTAAVTKNTNAVFVFDASAGQYYYIEDNNGDGAASAGEYQSAVRELSVGISVDSFSMGQQWITFGPKGNTVDGGAIVLANSHLNTRRIRVFSGTGNVTVD